MPGDVLDVRRVPIEFNLVPTAYIRTRRASIRLTACCRDYGRRLAARGNSNCIQQPTSDPISRGAQRRYNAFLPRGWGFEHPWNVAWNRLL
jgi:hypothetical protein